MPKFIARFSNGLVITAKDRRRSYTHAWHATGRHAIGNEPWSFNGFGTSAERARVNMAGATHFARPELVTFSEVVQVGSSWVQP